MINIGIVGGAGYTRGEMRAAQAAVSDVATFSTGSR